MNPRTSLSSHNEPSRWSGAISWPESRIPDSIIRRWTALQPPFGNVGPIVVVRPISPGGNRVGAED
jgi:hypothetical protein